MLFLNREEQIHFRILIVIVLTTGVFSLLFTPKKQFIKNAVVEGQNDIEVNLTADNQIKVTKVKQTGKLSPDRIYINESPLEALIYCPGIGRQKAEKIIKERKRKPFTDWRDFRDRIKGISKLQVQVMIDAGVKLTPPTKGNGKL